MTYPYDPTTSIRASALSLAERCPGSWRLRAAVGEPPPSPEMSSGTDDHAELAALEPTPRAKMFREELLRRLGADPASARFEVHGTLPIGDGLQVTGTVDVLATDAATGEPLVIDYKTGSGAHLPPMVDDLQMLAYSAQHGYARVVRVQVGHEDGAFVVSRCEDFVTTDPLAVLEFIAAAARAALYPRAPFLPGGHCSLCRVRDACPAQHVLAASCINVPRIGSESAARTVALGLTAAERLIKTHKDALRRWVEEHGAVVDGGRVWGARVSQVEELGAFAPSIFRFVAARVGEEAALACVSITGASLARGLSASLLDAAAIARIRGELRAAGLTASTTATKWGWHKLGAAKNAEEEE